MRCIIVDLHAFNFVFLGLKVKFKMKLNGKKIKTYADLFVAHFN